MTRVARDGGRRILSGSFGVNWLFWREIVPALEWAGVKLDSVRSGSSGPRGLATPQTRRPFSGSKGRGNRMFRNSRWSS